MRRLALIAALSLAALPLSGCTTTSVGADAPPLAPAIYADVLTDSRGPTADRHRDRARRPTMFPSFALNAPARSSAIT